MRDSTASFSSPSRARASIAGRSARPDRRRTRTFATTRPRRRHRRPASVRACVAGPRPRRERRRGPAHRASCRAALRLIGEGALDREGVEALADRLGVTARHLRRLFVQHLGATPIEVALTRRVHFAKKLLDETPLPIAQIAFAAGFGSLRRFNGEMRRTFSRTPTELRRSSRKRSDSAGSYQFRLAYRPPYDWAHVIGFLAARATPGVELVEAGRYQRTIAINGTTGTIAVSPADEGAALTLDVQFGDPRALLTIVERVRRMFDIGADPSMIAQPVVRRSPLEARRRRARRHPHTGRMGPVRDHRSRDPRPADLGARGDDDGRPRRRSLGHADREWGVGSGEWGVDAHSHLPNAGSARRRGVRRGRHHLVARVDAPRARPRRARRRASSSTACLRIEALCAIPGIGDWTAQYVAMRALNEPDAFPSGDLILRRMAGDLSARELERRSEAWRPWRAYAVMLLWQAATDGEQPTRRTRHADVDIHLRDRGVRGDRVSDRPERADLALSDRWRVEWWRFARTT